MMSRVDEVRAFNRYWTRQIGALRPALLDSPFSLTEVRVMYELAGGEVTDAAGLCERLELDAGYVSRILARFRSMELVRAEPAPDDGRRRELRLTAKGKKTFAALDARSSAQVSALLEPLADGAQVRLVGAMQAIRATLEPAPRPRAWQLRAPAPGDLGWIVERHGVLYAAEYGWDARFEGLVAQVIADFAARPDPGQRAWIAEVDGERAGCILCTRKDARTAKLRVLLVEPWARGLGIGERLVAECIAFAKAQGYRKMTLWTNSVLHAARRIYERAGFVLVEEEPHDEFGEGLIGQTWELPLRGTSRSTPSTRTSRRR